MTVIGFTGTQYGMTDDQKQMFRQLLTIIEGCDFHHGDCLGADEEAAAIAKELNYHIIGHPPIKQYKRAFFTSDEEWSQKDYLDRNKDIVNESEVLIAAPKGPEELRSGTWSTVRYARKMSKKILIINPDGTLNDK